ncbi:SpoIIE family protein phosphatase [Modestobacter muralis]|uniref:SpoIIE family protein phosphatase n=1 Tax=Modestobacter muralis TaxID=1608614 RepID=A0A6P0H5B5_9ACTN|nr:SpoIIE family protein phosphatase [Modestobacter muralis]NEK93692.1 SpoIIE family protein phosphatase [Modestobacter muralis]NEN50459.1 SpoIIE family protein phosphatase [Modestobacter muralis]
MTVTGAPAPSDLLMRAVEGMARPLFVLDDAWRFSYMNPSGAALLGETVGGLVGRVIWEAYPETVGSLFEQTYRRVAATGVAEGFEAWFAPLGIWFQVDAFRTDGGLVVTYDDVTARRQEQLARAEAAAAREEEAVRAAAAAEEAALAGRHLMLLGDISQAMTSTLDVEEAVHRFADRVVPILADWCLVSVVEDGVRRDIGRAHRDPAQLAAVDRYADLRVRTNRPNAPVPTSLREGTPVVIQQLTDEAMASMVGDARALEALRVLQPSAVAVYPLIAREELFGALTLVNGPERGPFTDLELRTAAVASFRAALALDNARLASAQVRVAERLQRSLLSDPVQPDDLEVAVRYRPATKGIAIGGDWYDAFQQPDGDTVLVIGDVVGHDLEAAATMGQLKTTVRAIAYDRQEPPAQVLGRADRAVAGLGVATLATALVGRIESGDEDRAAGRRRLRWASAGHPMPMLVQPDGAVVDLDAPVGPPLGTDWRGPRVDGVAELLPGSTLLLFTDGLFERRTGDLDTGRDRLRAAVAALAGEPLADLCDGLLTELLIDGAEDDVALLAVRAHPAGR